MVAPARTTKRSSVMGARPAPRVRTAGNAPGRAGAFYRPETERGTFPMQLANENKPNRRSRANREGRVVPLVPSYATIVTFHGIHKAAAQLGVTPFWLRSVLKGRAESRALVEDCYKQFPALVPPDTLARYGLQPTPAAAQ